MADREEPCRLVRRHPLAGSVFWTESYLLPLTEPATRTYPHHFVLWADHPTIEVGGPDDKLDLDGLPEPFCGFSTTASEKLSPCSTRPVTHSHCPAAKSFCAEAGVSDLRIEVSAHTEAAREATRMALADYLCS